MQTVTTEAPVARHHLPPVMPVAFKTIKAVPPARGPEPSLLTPQEIRKIVRDLIG